ncbi:MAG: alpha/beta hydrolase [Dehalobacterium sp.]
MGFVKVNNINLHYEIRGTGPKVLFIHGIGADLKNPAGIFNSPLPQHFTVLAFDPRGLGESDSPTESCSIADMADDAAGLAAAVGWEKYHVFGASMGGMVAQELMLRHSSAVEKLVLGVTNAGIKSGAPVLADKVYKTSAAEGLRIIDTRRDEAWVAANTEAVKQAEQQWLAVREAMRANPALLRGFNNQVNAALKHDTFDRLSQIMVPTFIFGGLYDGSNPPKVTQMMAQRIPNSRLALVEHGHSSWFLDPKVWEMIIDFLGN